MFAVGGGALEAVEDQIAQADQRGAIAVQEARDRGEGRGGGAFGAGLAGVPGGGLGQVGGVGAGGLGEGTGAGAHGQRFVDQRIEARGIEVDVGQRGEPRHRHEIIDRGIARTGAGGTVGPDGDPLKDAQQHVLLVGDVGSLAARSDFDGAAALVALFALDAIHRRSPRLSGLVKST